MQLLRWFRGDELSIESAKWLRAQRHRALNIVLGLILLLGTAAMVIVVNAVVQRGSFTFNSAYYSIAYVLILLLFVARKVSDEWRGLGLALIVRTYAERVRKVNCAA